MDDGERKRGGRTERGKEEEATHIRYRGGERQKRRVGGNERGKRRKRGPYWSALIPNL